MLRDETIKKLNIDDIAYYGKPLDTLNRDELMEFCLHLAQTVYECANKGQCIQGRRNAERC